MASKLKDLDLVDEYIVVDEYITPSILKSFNLQEEDFWSMNPYFSTAQIVALHYMSKADVDYVFHTTGDVWLSKCCSWIKRAVNALESNPTVLGFNLCRNIYINEYPKWARGEDGIFWLSKGPLEMGNPRKGFGLSDLAYVLRVYPEKYYDFYLNKNDFEKYKNIWPDYARPCFEMYIRKFLDQTNYDYGALKPDDGCPIIKHKNFSKKIWKQVAYLKLGKYYKKYAPHFSVK